MKKITALLLTFAIHSVAFAVDDTKNDMLNFADNEISLTDLESHDDNLLTTKKLRSLSKAHKREVRKEVRREKRAAFFARLFEADDDQQIVGAILAFFLGVLGIHRVYLGGSPLLILLYIITLGGFLGILPLIDFIRLVIGHTDHYIDNDDFFAAFKEM